MGHLAAGLAVAAEGRYATVTCVAHRKASARKKEPAAQGSAIAGGSSPRTWQRRAQWKTQGRNMELGSSASWGAWVPYPGCFTTDGKQEACSGGLQGAGVPDSGCLAQAHTRIESMRGLWVLVPACLNLFWQVRRRQAVCRTRPLSAPEPCRQTTKAPTPARMGTHWAERG